MAKVGKDTPASPEPADVVGDKLNKPRPNTAGFIFAPYSIF